MTGTSPSVMKKQNFEVLLVPIIDLGCAADPPTSQSCPYRARSIYPRKYLCIPATCWEPSHILAKLTAYLTVYDSLSLWYRASGMQENPLRYRHFSESQMGADGFRVRIASWLQRDVAQHH
jgi:hypothetical protein